MAGSAPYSFSPTFSNDEPYQAHFFACPPEGKLLCLLTLQALKAFVNVESCSWVFRIGRLREKNSFIVLDRTDLIGARSSRTGKAPRSKEKSSTRVRNASTSFARFGHLDLRRQAEVASVRRSDTPKCLPAQASVNRRLLGLCL